MRNQPGLPRSLAAEDAQGCPSHVTGQKGPDLGNQTHSLARGAVCLVERRQGFTELPRCLLPAGEGRRKPSSVLSPCNLCSNERFSETATKLLGTGIEAIVRPDGREGILG